MLNRVHNITVQAVTAGRETDYVAVCSCGFEALPVTDRHSAVTQRCEVMEAELEGVKRRARRLGRLAAIA